VWRERTIPERPRRARQARLGHVFAGVERVLEHLYEEQQDLIVSLNRLAAA